MIWQRPVAEHTLICATAFFTLTDSHKSVHSQRVLLTHFSWCASSAQPAVMFFFQFRQPAFDKNALLEPEHFEDSFLAGKEHGLRQQCEQKCLDLFSNEISFKTLLMVAILYYKR
jgi:hypothetical protein